MKKIFALALVFALCVTLFAACDQTVSGGKGNHFTTSTSTDSTNNTNGTSSTAQPENTPPIEDTVAVVVGEHEITAVELNYFYVDAIQNFYQTYSSYISFMLDPKAPLSQQVCDPETKQTWADYFVEIAHSNIRSTYAIVDDAKANGFTLSMADQQSISNSMEYMDLFALYYGFESTDAYLAHIYGEGATADTYRTYYENCIISESYYQHYANSLEYTPEELLAYQQDKPYRYHSYTYATYYLAANRFDSPEAALSAANALASGNYTDLASFDAAIQQMQINQSTPSAASTKYQDVLYRNVNTLLQAWISHNARNEGEMTVIASYNDDTLSGYYVVRFGAVNKNDFAMKNVRHLLVKDTTDAGKAKAEELLAQWQAGDATEDSFIALVKEHSADNKHAGGLYENIYPGQMVAPFENWCYDADRQPGDYGIVKTDYGYHIMYFLSDSEMTYRQLLIADEMLNEDLDRWYNSLVESISLTAKTDRFVNKDITMV